MARLRYLLSAFFISAVMCMQAQSVKRDAFYSSGSFATGASVSLQSNIGELMAATWNNSQNYLSQGFVQPDQSLITLVNTKDATIEAKAFPNPVAAKLSVELSGAGNINDLTVEVFDIVGKKQQVPLTEIYSNDSKSKFELDLKGLTSGIYFIRITSGGKEFSKTLKINKL